MYHVFHITGFEAEGNAVITAVNTTGCESADGAEALIKCHGWKPGTGWYGSSASGPEAAIVEALSVGFHNNP